MRQRHTLASSRALTALAILALGVGCSDASEPGNGNGGSSGGKAGSAAGVGTGGAGSNAGGAGSNAGGAGSNAGSGGNTAPDANVDSTGGGGRGGSGGGGSGGSTGGSAGQGAAGEGDLKDGGAGDASAAETGSAGRDASQDVVEAGASDLAAADVLNKYQLLDPCDLSNYRVESGAGAVCPQTDAVKNQHLTRMFGGDPAVTYKVTLRVRAIMEHYWYAGGKLDPVSKTFYTGGVPTVGGYASACKNKASTLPFKLPSEVTPTDGCFNGFNVFAMTVSAPKESYYLNYTTDKVDDRPPHAVYNDDYTVTIPIQGQAAIDFYIIGSDEHQCYNHSTVVSGVTLPMSPYIGNFVQFDVVKVER